MNFIEVFFENLERYPYRPLITEARGGRLLPATGNALAKLVAAARGTLRAHAVKPGQRVVLLAPNSIRWLASDLAILGEGAIVVPMYARQDPAELVGMMHDCTPSLIVCADADLEAGIKERWPEAPTLLFEEFFAGDELREPVHPRAPEDPVTIIYTSGTSGIPKGVVSTTANIDFMLNKVCASIIDLLGERGMGERVFHYLPFNFAGSRIVLWMCFFRAKNLITSTNLDELVKEIGLAAPNYFLNVPRVLERIRAGVEGKIRTQSKPIQAFYQRGSKAYAAIQRGDATWRDRATYKMAKRILFDKIKNQIGPNLELLLSGSAPLGEETQQWFGMLGLPIYQIYGLTETTAIITMDRPGENDSKAVGFVIDGVETKLGESNELLVRGPNVFNAYWERPEASAAAFDEDGWFHTGDQAAWDPQGRLQIVGRLKALIVHANGHNIAPEPIEHAILEAIELAEQVVVFGHGRSYLSALITGDVTDAAVQTGLDAVNETLPHYRRVRSFFLQKEALTSDNGLLTANMKLRRKAIEEHFSTQIEEMYPS